MEQSKGTKARALSIGYLSVDAVRDEPICPFDVLLYVVCSMYYDVESIGNISM